MMTEQPTVETAVWYEAKAFTAYGLGEKPEHIAEFRGEGAEASARSWYERMIKEPAIDAVYLYEVRGDEHTLITSWSDSYAFYLEEEDASEEEWYERGYYDYDVY